MRRLRPVLRLPRGARSTPGSRHAADSSATPVTVLHDYFTQRGGAERVAVLLAKAHGGGAVRTSAVAYAHTFPEVAELDVRTLLPQLPGWLVRQRAVLGPLAGVAFLLHRVDHGVVVCSSSGWAHWVRGRAPRLVYCHTPARWLYEPDDYFRQLPTGLRRVVSAVLSPLRVLDRWAMRRATVVMANGPVTAERIRRAYQLDSPVVVPPPGLDATGPQEPVTGLRDVFDLVVARPRGYKNLDLATSVYARRTDAQLVVVGGTARWSGEGSARELGRVSDAQLRWLYAHARAVVCLAHEDLGLVPIEAFQFGTPAVALRAGGYLTTCTPGVNTVFVDSVDAVSLNRALDVLATGPMNADTVRASAAEFSLARFQRTLASTIDQLNAGGRVDVVEAGVIGEGGRGR
jgi:glycosyltransferase involved in cell wall biosynthesis